MDPQAQTILDSIATLAPDVDPAADDAQWLADFRYQTALLKTFSGEPEPVHAITHLLLPSEAGPLVVRLYRPKPGPLPLLFYIHGGGAIAGSIEGHDPVLRALANRTGWLVAAPAYRLAPEHRFPAQLDDSWTALTGLVAQAAALDIDATRIVVSGDSIGGTLATALAARSVAENAPALSGQILLYPNTDLRSETEYESRKSEDGNVIDAASLERQIDLYLASPDARTDPRASPILAENLSALPPTLLVTCENDPLRDEGEAYGQRLREAGVAVDHRRYDGMIHAFLQFGGRVDATSRLLDRIAAWLKTR
ncbi:alpha/beta hydrolase [Sphingomonas faeni]|uniref:alpha/beta hydrolase n=1 Tax=Sphingomonas faeni TaxID=185950 RepID=UPI0020C0F5EE|nr:alpha/beta hydrolase [Sphingomonas faeni]